MLKISIYCLRHPKTKQIHYVGKTLNVKRSYPQEVWAKHKSVWVQSILQQGMKPIVNSLKDVAIKDVDSILKKYREKYNITDRPEPAVEKPVPEVKKPNPFVPKEIYKDVLKENKVKAYVSKYYQLNKERILADLKLKRKGDKSVKEKKTWKKPVYKDLTYEEKIKAYKKSYYEKNKKQILADLKIQRRNNK